MTKVVNYIWAVDRNSRDTVRSHLYAIDENGDYFPMCGYGWNRSDGQAFSIFRGHSSRRGNCKTCEKRRKAGLPPIRAPWKHKTMWI